MDHEVELGAKNFTFHGNGSFGSVQVQQSRTFPLETLAMTLSGIHFDRCVNKSTVFKN